MTKQILTGMSSRALVNGNEAMLGNNRASIAISPGEGLGDTPAELRVDDAAMTRIVELDGPTGQQFGSSTVSLTTAGAASTENFNSLVGTGSGFVNTTLPTGWYVDETLGGARDNEAYGVDTGGSTTGDTYSYGTAASSDRALGQLRSGTVTSSIGAQFTNNTGSTLGSLQISFTGEQWRFGGTHTTVGDKLNFQISFDATSLTTGTWVDIDSLDFSSPVTTGSARALDGNHTDNRTAISATIASLAIANGATFWIRFIDVDATSSDDGLAIDDFSITPIAADGPTPGVLTIANVTTNEGNSGTTDMVFTVTRASGSQGAVDVTYTITNGTTDAGDFGAGFVSTATVSFADGQTSAQIHVPVSGDTSYEGNETFTVTLSGPTGGATLGAQTAATGTITNDDAAPAGTLSIGNASLSEGNSGDTDIVFTVTRADGSAGAVSATWTITNGTTNASDFGASYATTGSVNFADGATTAEVRIPVHGDTAYEPNETFTVTLSAPTGGAVLGTTAGTGTITNDDAAPPPANIWINEIHYDNSSTDVGEAIEIAGIAGTDLTGYKLVLYNGTNTPGAAPSYNTLTLSGTIDNESNGYGAVSFAYAVNGLQNGPADGIALISPDGQIVQFLSYGGTITAADGLAAGATSTDIGVSESPAPGVGFSLQLTGTGSTYNDFTWQNPADDNFGTANTGQSFLPAIGTSHIRVEDASAVEGNSGTTNITFTVHRAGGQAAGASVDYTVTLDGTANASDFGAAAVFSGTVTFAIDEFTKTVTIPIQGDTTGEHNETFHVVLGSTTGDAVVDRATATGTITNDDPLPLLIGEIQGEGHTSVYVGQTVIATGIVTAVDTNGFYLQDAGDGNSATSDGIFVFTSTTPTVAVGDGVQVTGAVAEFLGAAGSLTLTQINSPSVQINTHNNALPTAVLIGTGGLTPPSHWIDNDGLTSYDPTTDGVDFWESMEGMRVTIDNPLVVSNTTSFGETDVVASLGVGASGVNDRGGITISPNDGEPADFNPEKIQIDDDSGIFAGFNPNYSIGDHLSSVTGILNYAFVNYEVIVTEAVTLTQDVTLTKETTALVGDATHLSLATYNLENIDASDNKYDILADNIVYNLRAPDIIAVQEIQDTDGAGGGSDLSGTVTAQGLIDAIFAESGLIYAYIEIAPSAAGTTGGEPGGNIRNGYLYNTGRVTYVEGSAELITGSAYSGSRNPLVATWTFNGQSVTTINVHSTSRGGSEDLWGDSQPPADAGDAARTAQAAGIKAYINDKLATNPNLNIAVLGDWNGFYFEAAQTQLTDPGQGGVLTNLNTLLAAEERYSYLFNGNAQQIDNILVTGNLLAGAQYDAVHLNSQFGAAGRPTDHDPQLALFNLPTPASATNDNSRTAENATVVIDVRANDSNPNSAVTTIAGVAADVGVPITLTSGATVMLNADGTLTYNPNNVYNWLIAPETATATGASNGSTNDSFTYALANGTSATVNVLVSGVTNPGDKLLGTAGANTITGTSGADIIDGLGGADTMAGGLGNDTYYVDNSADVVTEASNSGTDTIYASATFALVGYVENLILTGGAAINGTGNSLANTITGNGAANVLSGGDGADILDGAEGADTMNGGLGDDTFYVDNVSDVVIEAGSQGTDTVRSSVTYSLAGQYIERLILTGNGTINGTGNSLANILTGNSAANTLNGGDGDDEIDGGDGVDTMIGGLGNDTFYVDQAGDTAVEAANQGTDTVRSSITYSLAGQYIENLILTGGNAINGTGNSLANTLTGNGAANTLDGGDANDVIDGGAGADTMIGGLGDDSFYVDNAGDVVVEANGPGTDIVYASVTFSLAGQFIENLTLTGGAAINATGNKLNNALTGNGAANTLNGGEGNDLLDGGAGADTLVGGLGDDTYIVDNAGDVVVEAASSGTDSVYSSVSYSLAGQYIENLTLTGVAAVDATGNSLANVVTGNSAANVLNGMDGNDSLHGGLGADTLTGGNGSDGFYFDTALGGGNMDTITDFNVVADTIYLEGTIFTAAGSSGVLAAGAFVNGSVALDADDRILYDSATGNIYYDADGSGAGAAVQFAKVTAGTALTRNDFVIEHGIDPENAIVPIGSLLGGAEDNMALVRFTLGGDATLSDDRGSAEIVSVEGVTRADMIHARSSQSAVLSIADLIGGHDALDLGSAADAMIVDGDVAGVSDDSGFLPMVEAVPQYTQLLSTSWAHDPVL